MDSSSRKSYDIKSSYRNNEQDRGFRDSGKTNLAEYSIDVELTDNNKKMLEAFKVSSGFYNNSPKKNRSPTKKKAQESAPQESERIYLFGNKGDNYKKPTEQQTKSQEEKTVVQDTKISQYYSENQERQRGNSVCLGALKSTSRSQNASEGFTFEKKYEKFIKQIFNILGLMNENDQKLQFQDLIGSSHSKFIEMKSNGRWQLIQKYFKGSQDDDLAYSNMTATNANKNILKKRTSELNSSEKKKVKLVEPETVFELTRTKQKLADDLQKNLQKLTKGYTFKKLCFNSQKIQQIKIYLSYDLKFLAWQAIDKKIEVSSMQSYNGILDGPRSKNYQKYVLKKYPIDEKLAFSVILKQRTLDLMASNFEDKVQFIESIKFVRNFI